MMFEQEPRSSGTPASDEPSELEVILRQPIPFPGSSTPADAGQAQRYALRLEHRWKLDQRHILDALRQLGLADTELLEQLTNRTISRMSIAIILGHVQSAVETLRA